MSKIKLWPDHLPFGQLNCEFVLRVSLCFLRDPLCNPHSQKYLLHREPQR
jgi:hypothetical protein